MNTLTYNKIMDNYLRFMKYWNTEAKENFIKKLNNTLDFSKDKNDFSSCFGAWKDSRSADEIIFELKTDRLNIKEIEAF